MRWLCAAVMCPMLACQPFDDVGVLGQGDSLIVASETRFFSLYGVSSAEVEVVLARDVAGAVLELEGQTVEGLLLPPDQYCVLEGVAAFKVVRTTTENRACHAGETKKCHLRCGNTVWNVSVR
jgi:hypothetical protein